MGDFNFRPSFFFLLQVGVLLNYPQFRALVLVCRGLVVVVCREVA